MLRARRASRAGRGSGGSPAPARACGGTTAGGRRRVSSQICRSAALAGRVWRGRRCTRVSRMRAGMWAGRRGPAHCKYRPAAPRGPRLSLAPSAAGCRRLPLPARGAHQASRPPSSITRAIRSSGKSSRASERARAAFMVPGSRGWLSGRGAGRLRSIVGFLTSVKKQVVLFRSAAERARRAPPLGALHGGGGDERRPWAHHARACSLWCSVEW